jgi:kynurenine formamidase
MRHVRFDFAGKAVIRAALLTALLAVAACTPATPVAQPPNAGAVFPSGELVDLSHTYDKTTIFWPTATPFALESVAAGMTPGGYYYAANNFSTSEHGGTHLDSPVHFAEGKSTVDQIALNRLVGPAVVIDVTAPSNANADHQITVADIEAAERQDGPIPANAIVVLRTGFSRRWPDAVKYLGTAERGDAAVAKLHFPGLHPDAAKWLIANRPIRAIGIDTASIDYGQSTLYESHRALFANEIPAFENLTSLERLPKRGAYVIALPMKIGGGSGAPLRAIAIVP